MQVIEKTQIVVKVAKDGRVQIPSNIRVVMGIEKDDMLDITINRVIKIKESDGE